MAENTAQTTQPTKDINPWFDYLTGNGATIQVQVIGELESFKNGKDYRATIEDERGVSWKMFTSKLKDKKVDEEDFKPIDQDKSAAICAELGIPYLPGNKSSQEEEKASEVTGDATDAEDAGQ